MSKVRTGGRKRDTRAARDKIAEHISVDAGDKQTRKTDILESDLSDSEYAPDEDIVESFSVDESDEANDNSFNWDQDEDCDDIDIDALLEVDDQIRQFDSDALPDIDPNDADALFDGNLYPAEYFRKRINTLDPGNFRRKEYAKGTENTIKNAERQWITFCTKVLKKRDWKYCLQNITFPVLYNFLDWYLGQRTGRNGRRKRPVRSRSSLVTFWCCFRLAFQRAANWKINMRVEADLVHNALVQLGNKYKLTYEKRENRAMTLSDLHRQLQTTLSTTEKAFKLGEIRVLAVLFLLLLAPQGSRPASILQMRFGDIEVKKVRDPTTLQPRLVVELSLAYTKRYLGPKAEKTFILPEILFDPTLIMSPHVFLLAILFRHEAFVSEDLNNNPHKLSDLDINPAGTELPLHIKDNMKDTFVFRQCEKLSTGWVMGERPMTPGMMGSIVKRVGKILGFERNTICYSLRYMAGNNLNESVTISSDLRNLTLDHSFGGDTFQKHYLSRFVRADLWAIHRDLKPQDELLKQVASHGSSTDARLPISLTKGELAQLKADPVFVRLTDKLFKLRKGTPERRKLSSQRDNYMTRLRKEKLESIRAEWIRKQALDDIKRQIHGRGFIPHVARPSRAKHPTQEKMLQALEAPLINNMRAEFDRRAQAIQAIINYCNVEEPLTSVLQARPPATAPEMQLDPMERGRELRQSTFGQIREVKRCFFCVAVALTLFPDDPALPDRLRDFYDHASLSRHFISVHLNPWDANPVRACPICVPRVSFYDKMHLQNHAEAVHGIKTERRKKKC